MWIVGIGASNFLLSPTPGDGLLLAVRDGHRLHHLGHHPVPGLCPGPDLAQGAHRDVHNHAGGQEVSDHRQPGPVQPVPHLQVGFVAELNLSVLICYSQNQRRGPGFRNGQSAALRVAGGLRTPGMGPALFTVEDGQRSGSRFGKTDYFGDQRRKDCISLWDFGRGTENEHRGSSIERKVSPIPGAWSIPV
jgi:hypothetical protein